MCLFLYKELNLRPNRVSQWIFANLDDLSLIPGPTKSKKKLTLASCLLPTTLTWTCEGKHTLHIHAHKMNK